MLNVISIFDIYSLKDLLNALGNVKGIKAKIIIHYCSYYPLDSKIEQPIWVSDLMKNN